MAEQPFCWLQEEVIFTNDPPPSFCGLPFPILCRLILLQWKELLHLLLLLPHPRCQKWDEVSLTDKAFFLSSLFSLPLLSVDHIHVLCSIYDSSTERQYIKSWSAHHFLCPPYKGWSYCRAVLQSWLRKCHAIDWIDVVMCVVPVVRKN